VVLAFAGALAANVSLVSWAIGVGAMGAAAIAWTAAAWRDVEISVGFQPRRAFISEPVEVLVHVENRKRLPLPLVRLGVWLPEGLAPGDRGGPQTIRGFRRRFALPGRSSVDLHFPVDPERRGEYRLRLVEVEVSDPFGLAPLYREVTPPEELLVLPEPRIQIPVEVRRRLPFGAPAPSLRMYEQPERFAGVRPYASGDPLNRIHWKATAHAGALHTKLFEPTRTADVVLLLDLAVGEPFWDSVYPEIAEDTIGWASFLARQAIHAGWRVGMMANTHLSKGRGPLRVPASTAKGHEAALFAALARMPNEPTSDLAPVLRENVRRMGQGATVVVISPRPGPGLSHQIALLRRRGLEVVALSPLDVRPRWTWPAEGEAGA
jgi:uncharacterized protein (DUF58 family)